MSQYDKPHPIRRFLSERSGPDYWRSLDELLGTPEFNEFLEGEFPRLSALWEESMDRRTALKLLGASLALAGLGGCGDVKPLETLVPYVDAPDGLTAGRPLHFATALTLGGYARGVLVESREGRPIKVEGNPRHPASLGATDLFAQGEILSLYDPDRSQAVTRNNRVSSWQRFLAAWSEHSLGQGEGLHVLTGAISSPSLGKQLEQFLERYPRARWHVHEPVDFSHAQKGAELLYGQPVDSQYRFDKAKVILSLDADFLLTMPGSLRYARDFSKGRRLREGSQAMNRLYVVQSTSTVTGAMADHKQTIRAAQMETVARDLVNRLGPTVAMGTVELAVPACWQGFVLDDLQQHRGASLVVPGAHQAPVVHALALLINHQLGNLGETVVHSEPVLLGSRPGAGDLAALAEAMQAGQVQTLLILDTNPVYTAPAHLNFAQHLKNVELTVHHGLYHDETAQRCDWHIPALHELEAWGDARAYDGTVTLQQPLIAPLYKGHSTYALLAALSGWPGRSDYELVRAYWRQRHGEPGFEKFWREALHQGVVPNSAAAPVKNLALREDWEEHIPAPSAPASGLEIQFRPDPTLWDGRYANNPWLQELPKPITQLTWGNAALMSPGTAAQLGLQNEEVIELRHEGQQIFIPIWMQPNHPEQAVTLYLGHGRSRSGGVGQGQGVNVYPLRRLASPWILTGAKLRKTGEKAQVVTTQHHHAMHGRHLLRHTTLSQFLENPDLLHDAPHEKPPTHTLYPEYNYEDNYAWGMIVDASACIGCKACTIACQAENNIPVVGKEQVARGREMHWLRVDVWHQGALEHPHTYFQPVPCMHCEKAPCEYVCPVEATLHTAEGLNAMVYNRCVGTRFCSQNCPYKVRRFNFLEWTSRELAVPPPVQNPEVTVRSRGVMEKCTYCVQRISRARIEAKKENRRIGANEVHTACQQVCPTQAIVFGDLNHPDSQVARYSRHPLSYQLLAELNTRPRTRYLAHVRNPNPGLEDR